MVASDKVLGVLIDNNLTWTNHTDAVAKKIVSIFGCCPELRNTCLLIKEFNFKNPKFNPILIIAMPSGEELLKEILVTKKSL